ncbi:MAG: type II CRISPR RNA-guided endonuclease Cas9 [Magnetospirillum sp. WYHS-4]
MSRILGLDVGIGSVGWAIVDLPDIERETGEIVGDFAILEAGSRCFPVPEDAKTKELSNKKRRQFRGQRKVIRRRRGRMKEIRALLAAQGLPADPGPVRETEGDAARRAGLVWHLRAEGLERELTSDEWARVLIHLAKHRGFKSTSKRDHGDNNSDSGKMLSAIKAMEGRMVGGTTVGALLARDPDFADRKRNRSGDYSHTLPRWLLEEETAKLFSAQAAHGNPAVGEGFAAAYLKVAFDQRKPRHDTDSLGECAFVKGEKRAPRQAPSFERFRFLSKLNSLRLVAPGIRPRAFSPDELRKAQGLFASHKEITYKTLRGKLKLPEAVRFEGVVKEKENKDPETRKIASFEGTIALKDALGEARFSALSPETLDAAAGILRFVDDLDCLRERLALAGLDEGDVKALTEPASLKAWSGFTGIGHLSTAACRRLRPHLEEGLVYSDACNREGWDHRETLDGGLDKVNNPVVAKSVREAMGQVRVAMAAFKPDLVHLEMARDLGKSPEERDKITKGLNERTAEREKIRETLRELLKKEPNGEEMERYELWCEQNHRCPYTDEAIPPGRFLDDAFQVDHILPYSRSGDDSFRNKVLCTTKANQEKRNRSAWEWFGESDPERWALFEARVDGCKSMHKEKRRKLLMRTFADREKDYRARHMNDTRYAMRVLKREIETLCPQLETKEDEKRRLFTRPGAVTALARKAWGLNGLKADGILGDRDHALDAIVLACISEAWLQHLTKLAQVSEEIRYGKVTARLPTPLGAGKENKERFRQMVKAAAEGVFVSRSETRRGRGGFHNATHYGFSRNDDGQEVQYERVAVVDLKPEDLDRLKGDPERIRPLREVLTAWLAKAADLKVKPEKLFKDDPPRMPGVNGPVLRRVRLERKKAQSGIKIPRGDAQVHVDMDSLVRTDVFEKGGKYYLVPVYAWQVATMAEPPMRAIVAAKPEDQWETLDKAHVFHFSLHPDAYVKARNRTGEVFEGYYVGVDRATGGLTLRPHDGNGKPARPGTRLLAEFKKFHVDRFGRLHEIEKEPRIWRGAVWS